MSAQKAVEVTIEKGSKSEKHGKHDAMTAASPADHSELARLKQSALIVNGDAAIRRYVFKTIQDAKQFSELLSTVVEIKSRGSQGSPKSIYWLGVDKYSVNLSKEEQVKFDGFKLPHAATPIPYKRRDPVQAAREYLFDFTKGCRITVDTQNDTMSYYFEDKQDAAKFLFGINIKHRILLQIESAGNGYYIDATIAQSDQIHQDPYIESKAPKPRQDQEPSSSCAQM